MKGEWAGKPYQDKGVILQIKPPSLLQFTHLSPLAGPLDTAENYHTLTYGLTGQGDHSFVSLTQDPWLAIANRADSGQLTLIKIIDQIFFYNYKKSI